MAERSGDPELDALIEAYIAQDSFTDPLGHTYGLARLRTPDGASGMCNAVSQQFARFVKDAQLTVTLPPDMTPEACGYRDRLIPGSPFHQIALVKPRSSVLTAFIVDFTAAQYGYTEFPLVQKILGL